jgi:hypothetical protein
MTDTPYEIVDDSVSSILYFTSEGKPDQQNANRNRDEVVG